jgi:hypothetical protein
VLPCVHASLLSCSRQHCSQTCAARNLASPIIADWSGMMTTTWADSGASASCMRWLPRRDKWMCLAMAAAPLVVLESSAFLRLQAWRATHKIAYKRMATRPAKASIAATQVACTPQRRSGPARNLDYSGTTIWRPAVMGSSAYAAHLMRLSSGVQGLRSVETPLLNGCARRRACIVTAINLSENALPVDARCSGAEQRRCDFHSRNPLAGSTRLQAQRVQFCTRQRATQRRLHECTDSAHDHVPVFAHTLLLRRRRSCSPWQYSALLDSSADRQTRCATCVRGVTPDRRKLDDSVLLAESHLRYRVSRTFSEKGL